jgi:YHS domain-containing protein
MATDPVCGMPVDEPTAAGTSWFEGSKYYFCSGGCKQKFEAKPSAYAGTPSPAGDSGHPGQALKAGTATPTRIGLGIGAKQVRTVGRGEVRSW